MKLFFGYQVIDYIFIIAGIATAFFLPENFVLAGSVFVLLVVAGASNYIFQRMADRTKRELEEIMYAKSARLISEKGEIEVSSDQIKLGDILVVKEGEIGAVSAGKIRLPSDTI